MKVVQSGFAPLTFTLALALSACGDSAAGGGDAGPVGDGEGGTRGCVEHRDCWDGVFCNGDELCLPADRKADDKGCVPAPSGPCFASQECDEDALRCITDCAQDPDADGDGHQAEACGGDDCVDHDPNTYPGNLEVCDDNQHDEDCDATTYGFRDEDGDGYADARCCNTSASGDGLNCGEDCNDSRRNTHPNSVEACDERDNDCDGDVDEDVSITFYEDADGDGYGDPTLSMTACEPPAEHSLNGTDCDDGSADVNPAIYDRCDTSLVDDDCDGVPNNPAGGCSCEVGGSRPCVRPGACAAGVQNCVEGLWSECSIGPVPEQCNGVDDNCDGQIDEGCRCEAGAQLPCGLGVGQCRKGFQVCQLDDTWGACVGAGEPTVELCDVVDNDCDGIVDEDPLSTFFVDADGDGFGNPAMPVPSCGFEDGVSSSPLDCNDGNAAIRPGAPELCDNVDNNCNGRLDGPGEDVDGDNIAAVACGGLDCNDDDATTTSCSAPIIMGGVVVTSLVDLALLSGVTEITGNLTIDGRTVPNITQLSALSSLKKVGGTLTIQFNSALASLTGLSALKAVGSLVIYANDALTSLNGLQSLTDVTGTLSITDNSGLLDLTGLSGLTHLAGSLDIDVRDDTLSFDGLENLRTIAGDLSIRGCGDSCDDVDNIDALNGLTRVDGHVTIGGFDGFTVMNGLTGLTTIGKDLTLNGYFTGITGLTALTSIGGSSEGGILRITSSYQLTSIAGLSKLASIGTAIEIRYNQELGNFAPLNKSMGGALIRVGETNTGTVTICSNLPTTALTSATALVTDLGTRGWTGTAIVAESCP